MGIFTYTDPHTNRVYNFEYGGQAPTEEDYAYAHSVLEQERAAYAQQYQQAFGEAAPEYDDGTAFGRGWDRARANLSGGIGELLQTTGQRLGWQGLEDYGTAKEAAAAQRAGILSLEQPAPMDWRDVRGLGSGLTYLGELAGSSAPVSLAGAAGMLGGALAAPVLGVTGLGATALSLGAGALATLPSYAGENLQEQERQSGEGNVNLTKALGTAAVQSALDAAALRALGALGVGKSIFGGLSGDVGRGIGMRILTGGAEGALTEGGTEVLQEAATMLQAGIPLDSEEGQNRLISAMIGGGVLGGFLGGAGRGAFGKRPTTATEPEEVSPEIAADVAPEEVSPEIAGLLPAPLLALPAPEPAADVAPEAEPTTPAPKQDEDIVEMRGIFTSRLQAMKNSGATDEEARAGAARTLMEYIDTAYAGVRDPETLAKIKTVRDSIAPLLKPARTTPSTRDIAMDERQFAPVGEPQDQGDLFTKPEATPVGTLDDSYTPISEADAFEEAQASAEEWSKYRAEQARKAATKPTEPTKPTTAEDYAKLSPEAKLDYVNEVGLPPAPESETGLEVQGVDTAIRDGVAPIKVVENGKEVPFKNFALSVEGNKAEVGFVERDKSARRGVGYDAYVALGEQLAKRGVTLQSTQTLQAPGRALWERLVKQGKAKFNPETKRFEFGENAAPAQEPVAKTAQTSKPKTAAPKIFLPAKSAKYVTPQISLPTETALEVRRFFERNYPGYLPEYFGPDKNEILAKEALDRAHSNYDQKYGLRPDEYGPPHRRMASSEWTGYDFMEAQKEGFPEASAISAAERDYHKSRSRRLDQINNLKYDLKGRFPEFYEIIDADPVGFVAAAMADKSIPMIEESFRPTRRDGSETTADVIPFAREQLLSAPEPELTGDPLADASNRLDEVRADIDALRAQLPKNLYKSTSGMLSAAEVSRSLPPAKRNVLAALMTKMKEADSLRSTVDRLTAELAAREAANAPTLPDLREPVVPAPPLTWRSEPVPTTAMPDVRLKGVAGMPAAAAKKVREAAAYKELVGLFMKLAPEGVRKYTMARGGINNASAWKDSPEWTTLEDKQAVIALLKRMSNAERAKYTKQMKAAERTAVPKLTAEEDAAHTYFSKTIRPSDAIEMMIDDLTVDYDRFESQGAEAMSARPEEFARGTGRAPAKAALKWVAANMSKQTNERVAGRRAISARLDKLQETWLAEEDKVDTARAKRKAEVIQKRAQAMSDAIESGYIDDTVSRLIASTVDPLAAIDMRLHYTVRQALANGDLRTALRGLAYTNQNKTVQKLATALADRVGTTRVRIVDPTDGSADARRLRNNLGAFSEVKADQDPDMANVILLNKDGGVNTQVLLHEMVHAVTTHIVRWEPNHPVTKELQKLLETLRENADEKPTEKYKNGDPVYSTPLYGLTNVSELVAETFTRAALDPHNSVLGQLMSRTEAGTFKSIRNELPLTATQKFLETISNFLRSIMRMPPKAWPRKTTVTTVPETSLDAVQRLVTGIMSPANQTLPAHVITKAAISPMIAINTINNAVRSAPVWDAAGRKRFMSNMNASMPEGLRRMLLGLLQLEWFADVSREYFPQVDMLKSIDDQKRGYISNHLGKFQALEDDLIAYGKTSPDAFKMLMSVMGYATRAQVDPTKPSSAYNGDPEKLAIWHEINGMMSKADGSGKLRTLFKRVRNSNLAIRKEIEGALWQKAQQATPDKVAQKSLYQQLLEKITKEGVIEPYFALMREGDFWLTYQARDTVGPKQLNPNTGVEERPLTTFLQTFTSAWERDKFLNQLRAAKDESGNPYLVGTPDEFMKSDAFRADRSVQPEFLKGTMNIIDSLVPRAADGTRSAQADEAVSAIQDLFLKFTPEHSMLRSFMQRKGARGFVGDITPLGIIDSPHDMAETLARKTRSMVSQIAAIKYGSDVQRLRNEAIKTEKDLQRRPDLTSGQKATIKAYLAEFDARARAVQSPGISRAAQNVRTLTFAWTLGGNISSAINALMQIPMIGYTHLLGKHSNASVMRQLGLASRLITNAGNSYRQVTYGEDGQIVSTRKSLEHFGSIANFFEVGPDGKWQLRSDEDAQKILKSAKTRKVLQDMDMLVEYMSSNGMLTHSQMQEAMIQENDWLASINKWSGMPMHFAERFNRQAMAIASYNLELDKMRAPDGSVTEDQKRIAAQIAVSDTELVNGTIGAATAPRHAQSAVGSVVFLYKRFGLTMARYIINAIKASVGKVDKNASPEVQAMQRRNRSIARYQLGGMLGTAALFSGAQGLPFYGELMAILNALFRDDDEEDFDTMLQKFLGEPYYHGALNYLTGAEIASRISLSGLIYRENRIQKDQSIMYDLIDTFGGPAVGTFQNFERGFEKAVQGDLYSAIETVMPAAIKSGFKSVRYATEGANTARGNEIVPVSYGDIALQLIGYTPASYARMQEFTSEERGIRNAITAEKQALYRRYYLATLERDAEEMADIWQEMQEFSRRHPERAITGKSIKQSMAAYANRTEEMIGGVSFNRSDIPSVLQSQREYDNPSIWAQ